MQADVTIKNTGQMAGAEVVQLYVHDTESSVERPVRELKGFRKVFLAPGESRRISFTIGPEDLSFFDAASHSWALEPGEFHVLVGTSSADLPVDLTLQVR